MNVAVSVAQAGRRGVTQARQTRWPPTAPSASRPIHLHAMPPLPEFRKLELAWWDHVDAACPRPVHSRLRYQWIRENTQLEYGGRRYQRTTSSIRAEDGVTRRGFLVTYRDVEQPQRRVTGVVQAGSGLAAVRSGASA